MGLLAPRPGKVSVFGVDVSGRSPESIAAQGVALVPQGRRIFRSLSVRENLLVAARMPAGATRHPPWTFQRVYETFPRLEERQHQIAGFLSGGEQQMLAMGRALATDPAVLLIDELSMGLAPLIVAELYDHVRRIAASGLSIVIVEQFVHEILGVADLAGIMLHGHIVETGTPTQIADDLTSAYLGGTHH